MKGVVLNKQSEGAVFPGVEHSPYLLSEVIREEGVIYDRQFRYSDDWVFEQLSFEEKEWPKKYTLFLKQQTGDDAFGEEYANAKNIEDIISCNSESNCAIRAGILDFQLLTLPDWLGTAFGTSLGVAKAKISELIFRKGNQSRSYGVIFEVYSPAYYFPEITKLDQWQVALPSRELFKVAFSKDESWVSLTQSALRPDLAQRYPALFTQLKQRLFEIMKESLPVLLTY
jgi:hypothetical protein